MFVENGHDRNYLNSIINENKYQAPNTENMKTKTATSSNYHGYQL